MPRWSGYVQKCVDFRVHRYRSHRLMLCGGRLGSAESERGKENGSFFFFPMSITTALGY